MDKRIIIGIVIIIAVGILFWLFYLSTKPLPGTKIADLGRGHVDIGVEVEYNSNPPTSGQHYEDWTRAGIYTDVKDDRNLVHSLEHGYVIMSYNCDFPQFTPGTQNEASGSAEASISAKLSVKFESDDCKKLVADLTSIYEKKGKRKLIILPRPNLDSKIALSAWNYLDKFNDFDSIRVEKFIGAHFNNGPEKTME